MERKKNSQHTVTVEGYTSEGLGVAHLEGQAVFIHQALEGERCRIRLEKVGKNLAFARLVELEEPSPARREPQCPYFGRCGGCAFWHMSYQEELRLKRQRVDDAFQRIGGLSLRTEAILGGEEERHYRNKSIYMVSPEGKLGFYRARAGNHQCLHAWRDFSPFGDLRCRA